MAQLRHEQSTATVLRITCGLPVCPVELCNFSCNVACVPIRDWSIARAMRIKADFTIICAKANVSGLDDG